MGDRSRGATEVIAVTPYSEVLVKLLLAVILGGIVGWERERADRPAGLRTHILVCVGSALVMVTSIDMWKIYHSTTNVDPARLAAQVVSGIGFLGAGTIMREGATVRGLTTAASLWVIAGVGLAAGAGLYAAAVSTVVIVLLALLFLSSVERRYLSHGHYDLIVVRMVDRPGQLGRIGQKLGELDVNIRNVKMREGATPKEVELELAVRMPAKVTIDQVVGALASVEGIRAVLNSH